MTMLALQEHFWKFIKFLKRVDIRILVSTPIIISLLLLFGWLFIADRALENVPETYTAIVGACSMFISSLGGLTQVIRKESPGLLGITFRGIWPVLAGILWIVVCWSLGALLLYSITW